MRMLIQEILRSIKTLSEKRAANVAEVLKTKGITPDRIIADSKGDTVQPYKNTGRKPGEYLYR